MMKDKVMSEKTAKALVVVSAIFLLLVGFGLYKLFEYQGINKDTTSRKIVNYDIKDYVETVPVVFNGYSNVYSKINVSRVTLKDLDNDVIKNFMDEEEKLIEYITTYYNEINNEVENYIPSNEVSSSIKMQINGAILSIYYELDFNLDKNIYSNNIKKYVITTNVDLATGRILSNNDLLKKYNYTRKYIVEKIFDEDLIIGNGQIVIDKNTNISLTKEDIERNKEEYINELITEFDNFINMYIDNKTLVIVYNKSELRNMFFDNEFDSELIVRYLK
ncbi:MAG: hypothetical protein PUH84_05280 [Firmicutes bacterium]|nr:hypothetical protein [Bacillota bacterium]